MRQLKIAHLYPDLMNLYGDRGNVTVLRRRCRWRDIDCFVQEVTVGGSLEDDFDLLFIGGGQDREQALVYRDLLEKKTRLSEMVAAGLVVLAVCGGYQLLGDRFLTFEGESIEGLGFLDVTTVGGNTRLIGNVLAATEIKGVKRTLVGFENHSGRTTLGPDAAPLAIVERGFGNNGRDRTEGARQGNVFGTYLHGSLLPKNAWLADHLLELALKKKYGAGVELQPLDDSLEYAAQEAVAARIEALRRRRWVPELFKR